MAEGGPRPVDAAKHSPDRRPLALLLDLDENLLDNSGIPDAVAGTCDRMAQAFGSPDPQRLRRANTEVWLDYWPTVERSYRLGHLDGSAVSLETWRRTLRACGCTDDVVLRFAVEQYQQPSDAAHRLFDDAVEFLAHVTAGGFRLALVTNGPSVLQRDKLRRLGLDRSFHAVVISGELGVVKPDPAPFLLALRRLGVRPQDAWHIGDSHSQDVAGARAAGVFAVWLNRAGTPAAGGSRADLEVTSLSEVTELLPMQ